MDLPVRDIVDQLTSSANAHDCLDILAATPQRLGFDIVGFREELDRPIAPQLSKIGARDGRFGWPSGFMAGWIAENLGRHFPIDRLMRKTSASCHWTLPTSQQSPTAVDFTSRQRHSMEYMRKFDIQQGLTIPVRLPFDRTGCVTWFAAADNRVTFDRPLVEHLQIAVQRFFDGIDRSRLWIATSPLSPRETECLHWAARGLSDKKIARLIDRSADTVTFHVRSSIRKLDAVNRTHAVALAVRASLIEPTDLEPSPVPNPRN